MKIRSALLTLALVAGCGSEVAGPGGDEQPVRELPEPALRMVAPTAVRVGDDISIFGKGFADKEVGQTRLLFEGIFQSSSGKSVQVRQEVLPRFSNQGLLTWNFGPNIPFTSEEETGTFRGVLRAVNVGFDGQQKQAPQAIGVELVVLPSILIRQMRPLEVGCPVGIPGTTDETPFLFELKAIGLKAGTQSAPLRFAYTFMKQNFQFSGYLQNQQGIDPESLFPKTGPVSVIDDVTNGTVSTLGSGVPKNVYVSGSATTGNLSSVMTSPDKLFGLTKLITAPVPEVEGNYSSDCYTANMAVAAQDSLGVQAKRTLKLKVCTPVTVEYDGNATAVRTYDPVPVSGCISGGDVGRDVTYSEMTSETRIRSFKFIAKQGVTVSGGFDVKVFNMGAQLSAELGFEVNTEVSSSKATDLKITGMVLPGQFAAFYRQTIKMERIAQLTGNGSCGTQQDMGQVVITDWVWSPDLAKGTSCPPLPPSNLSPGAILKPETGVE